MKISDYIVKYLKHIGVRYVYGYIGGSITHLVDSIYKEQGIDFFQFHHEQAAAFAASAFSKYSGNLKAVLATSGPGATNLITGIADAYFDSVPVLFLTGQVNTYDFKYQRLVRQFGFQETDIVNIVKPITKYSILLDNPFKVEEEVNKAVLIALSGRPGPVLIDIPMDIQRGEISPKIDFKGRTSYLIPKKKIEEIRIKDLKEIYEFIVKSKYPLILIGGGCRISKADKIIKKVAEKLSIPVVVSLMGKDCFPHDHPLFSGFIGAYGNRNGNIALAKSDLLIVLGSRLDSRQIGNVIDLFRVKNIIQIDIDTNEIGQRLKPVKYIVCDVKEFLDEFYSYVLNHKKKYHPKTNWIDFISRLKNLFSPNSELRRSSVGGFHYEVLKEISNNLNSNDVVCIDVGQNQMWAAQVIQIKEGQRFINSGGMAPMGYALPSAIAIALEFKKKAIVIAGDGGMQINIQELNLVGKLRLPIIIFVLNNKSLGMIKQFQEKYFLGNYCSVDENSGYFSANFSKIAKAYGINSIKIGRKTPKWSEKIKQILKSAQLPVLVEIDLPYKTYAYPKLEYNKPIDELDPPLSEEDKLQLRLSFDALHELSI